MLNWRGMFNSMSRWKASPPGELPVASETLILIACMAVASALSMYLRASSNVLGSYSKSCALSELPTDMCIRSQMPFAVGFRLVVGTSDIAKS